MLIALFIFFMGLNVQGWRKSGVNHVPIFELDPRNHLSEQHLLELAAVLGVMWTLSVLAFLYSSFLGIPPFINPLVLVVTMVVFLVNPTKTFMHEARFWLLRKLGRVFCAPFFFVAFADFWLADQLNSLVVVLLDFQYMICFYATNGGNWYTAFDYGKCVDKTMFIRPVIACLPAWLRFAQCLRRYRDTREKIPHLINALKYSTTFSVVIFSTLNAVYKDSYEQHNPFFYLWIISSIISSLYAYWWDMKMDWGLFDSNAGENRFLREEIVYTSPVGAEPAEDVRSRNEQPFFPFHRSGLLLLWRRRGLCAALRLGPVAVPGGNGLHPRRSHGLLAVSSRSIPAVRVELLPAGERAPEQLRQVSSRARHLGGADGRLGPGGHPEDDGRGGARDP